MLASNAELSRKLDALEKKYDRQFKVIFAQAGDRISLPTAGALTILHIT